MQSDFLKSGKLLLKTMKVPERIENDFTALESCKRAEKEKERELSYRHNIFQFIFSTFYSKAMGNFEETD